MEEDLLLRLIEMSNELGNPKNDFVILGEGNSSARIDDKTFWVKTSGSELGNAGREDFVRVRFEPVLKMLDGPDLNDNEIKQFLNAATVDAAATSAPSIETMLHALCLHHLDINFIGHTHPTPINAIACSRDFTNLMNGRLFPDEVVICGPAAVLVPYADPGMPLARSVYQCLQDFLTEHGHVPKTMYLQNHGFIALANSPAEVCNITAMAAKAARIRIGAVNCGGTHVLTAEAIERLHTRPDESYRRSKLRNR